MYCVRGPNAEKWSWLEEAAEATFHGRSVEKIIRKLPKTQRKTSATETVVCKIVDLSF